MPPRERAANYSSEKGKEAERDLVKYLKRRGWRKAERMVRTGFRTKVRTVADPGDITGTPGIVWSVKDWATDQHAKWMLELDGFDAPEHSIRLLVQKRAGYADAERWWCWMRYETLCKLTEARPPDEFTGAALALIRVEVTTAVDWLEANGYIPAEEAA